MFSSIFQYIRGYQAVDIELNDLLAVFAKSKPISSNIEFSKLQPKDAQALKKVLQSKPAQGNLRLKNLFID